MNDTRLITVAIHTYERALALRTLLENEGIEVVLNNVNIESPTVSSGIRVRIHESDLPLALRVIENTEVFTPVAEAPVKEGHTVVVPIDFSDYSLEAAKLAVRLAAAHKADICLLNAYIDPFLPGNMQLTDNLTYEIADASALEKIIDNADKMMDNFSDRLRALMKTGEIPAVKIRHKVMEGVPEDVIIEYTKLNPPYLVVMGTRCCDRKDRELIGSVAAEVLDGCRFTVLTVPEGTKSNHNPTRILFVCNLDQEDILAADTLYRIFPNSQARVTMVNLPSKRSYGDRKRHLAADALLDYCKTHFGHYTFNYTAVSRNDAENDINRILAEEGIDMIVVPNRKRNALSRLFNPGLPQRVLFHTDTQMMVIPV